MCYTEWLTCPRGHILDEYKDVFCPPVLEGKPCPKLEDYRLTPLDPKDARVKGCLLCGSESVLKQTGDPGSFSTRSRRVARLPNDETFETHASRPSEPAPVPSPTPEPEVVGKGKGKVVVKAGEKNKRARGGQRVYFAGMECETVGCSNPPAAYNKCTQCYHAWRKTEYANSNCVTCKKTYYRKRGRPEQCEDCLLVEKQKRDAEELEKARELETNEERKKKVKDSDCITCGNRYYRGKGESEQCLVCVARKAREDKDSKCKNCDRPFHKGKRGTREICGTCYKADLRRRAKQENPKKAQAEKRAEFDRVHADASEKVKKNREKVRGLRELNKQREEREYAFEHGLQDPYEGVDLSSRRARDETTKHRQDPSVNIYTSTKKATKEGEQDKEARKSGTRTAAKQRKKGPSAAVLPTQPNPSHNTQRVYSSDEEEFIRGINAFLNEPQLGSPAPLPTQPARSPSVISSNDSLYRNP
jgi:hypothetical protein